MNKRTVRRRIIDHKHSGEIAQQLCDPTDVLRIAVGEDQTVETVHPCPVQILTYDTAVTAFTTAINQPIMTIHMDVNGGARSQVQDRYRCGDPAAPARVANIKVTAGNSCEQMNDGDDERGQCPVGIIKNNSEPREERRSYERQKRNGQDKECHGDDDKVCDKRNRCDEVEVAKN